MATKKKLVSSAIARVESYIVALPFDFTTSQVAIAKWIVPQGMAVLSVSAVAQAKSGTQGVSTIDVLTGAGPTSLLAAPIDLTGAAGTVVEADLVGAPAPTKVAKDSNIQVNVVVTGGASPHITNLTLQIDYIPIDF